MKYTNVLLTIFCIVVIIILIVSVKQDLDMEKECKEQLEKEKLFRDCRLCCKFAEGTIIAEDTDIITVTINLSELNLSGIGE